MLTYYPSRFPDPRVTGSGYATLNVLTRFEKKGSGILDKHPGSVTLGDWATSVIILCSVADLDPGSGIGCLFDPWIRDGRKSASGSGIRDEQPG
jgi:hypothetical protein